MLMASSGFSLAASTFQRQPNKMVKHIQTIRWPQRVKKTGKILFQFFWYAFFFIKN